jgi:hypothetical protein
VEPAVLRAVIQVESAGGGFASDGRPLILFEPAWFSQATGGRFDATNPKVSAPAGARVDFGRTQDARWSILSEAFGLARAEALGATSWGAFQTPGRYFSACGYGSVFEFVTDITQSEERQLAAFERFLRSQGLVDELQRRDWEGFASGYEGGAGAGPYANALANAYARTSREIGGSFIDGLIVEDRSPLGAANFQAAAQRLGCEAAAVQAVVAVESG